MADAEVGDDEYGEDPTVNRLQSLAAGAARHGGRALRAVGHDGEPARDPRARRVRAPRCCARPRSHVYQYELAAAPAEQRRADAPAVGRARRHRRRGRRDGRTSSRRCRCCAREHLHGDVGRADRRRRDAHARAGSRTTAGCACTSTARGSGTRRSPPASSPRELIGRRRHRDVLPVEGLGAPVGSVLCGPADVIAEARVQRRRLGGGMRQAGVIAAAGIVALETMVERLADDHARARAARRRARASAGRAASIPRPIRTNIVCARLDALPERLRRAARRGRACAPARSIRAPCASSRTRTSTTTTSPRDHRRVRRAARRLTWSTTRSRAACSRSTRIPTIPRSRPAARSRAGPTPAPRCTCSSRPGATRAPTIPTPTPTRSPGSGSRRPRPRHACSGVDAAPPRSSRRRAQPTTRALRLELVRCVRSVRPDVVCCPDPTAVFFGDGYFNHRDHRDHRLGHARRGRARGRQPALLPRAARRGPRRALGARPCTSRARSSRTRGSTSPRRSSARSRRCSATRASSSRRATGSASSCATRPRRPGRAAGVTYAEAFRRIAVS